MEFFMYKPSGKLAVYAEHIWLNREYAPLNKQERILPHGAAQIIINLGNQYFRHFENTDLKTEKLYDSCVITGIHTKNIFMDSYSRRFTMGAILRPGAVTAMTGIPAHEFQNKVVSLPDVTGEPITELRQQLIAADSSEEKFHRFENYLSNLIDQNFNPNPAVLYSAQQLQQMNGKTAISAIRGKTGYSRRRFSELFKTTLGITPKQFAKICRFQHSLQLIQQKSKPKWTELTHQCGYYDQSHFIRDFQEFAGISPGEYQHKQGPERNHLPA